MANKGLFRSLMGALIPQADVRNAEGAPAYAMTPEGALAQYAATGCLNASFYYATAEDQLQRVLDLCAGVEPECIARTAIFARERGFMKDMPALLCAVLSVRSPALFAKVFPRVIDSGRMLRTFVQVIRSGAVGRKSLGSLPKRMVRAWLEGRDDAAVFRASVGRDPSLGDIVKMVHPRPSMRSREALYGWLIGRPHDAEALAPVVREFEAFKGGARESLPDVPFEMLTALDLGTREWAAIAEKAPWHMTRMNLNTFARHGVFAVPGMGRRIAERLRDPEAIGRARVFPYQILAAWASTADTVPAEVREALQDALEIALRNVPSVGGKVYVCPDVSGSMRSPVTGARGTATTKMRCVDVAALVAAALVRKNPGTEVIPFEEKVVDVRLNPRDSVLTNAEKLAAVGGGGTCVSAPLRLLNGRGARGDLVVFVSDNQSWVDAGAGRGTATLVEWNRFKARSPDARMVLIDLQPDGTTQARDREDILNVGGFSDQVFDVIATFAAGRLSARHWAGVIEAVEL